STETAHSYYPRDEERYVQGSRAGNAVVSVVLEDAARIHQVVTILDAHHPLEMEEETDESGVDISAAELSPMSGQLASESTAAGSPASSPTATGRSVRSGAEEVIPLAEEQIEVGKRSVDRGVTRVRRYVVERPVEKDITLRGQRVTIERRRPIETTGFSGEAFQ